MIICSCAINFFFVNKGRLAKWFGQVIKKELQVSQKQNKVKLDNKSNDKKKGICLLAKEKSRNFGEPRPISDKNDN